MFKTDSWCLDENCTISSLLRIMQKYLHNYEELSKILKSVLLYFVDPPFITWLKD